GHGRVGIDLVRLAAGMMVWRFTGGSHLSGQSLDAPDDARASLYFDRFADFFDLSPALPRRI
ncbi:MAG: hypothetical protein ABI633_13780, partial [Burkholderiales bacterium]